MPDASMKIIILTLLVMVLLVKTTVQSQDTMPKPVTNSLHQILKASTHRTRRSASDNDLEHPVRHSQRSLQHKLQLLNSAINSTQPGYATIIKEEGKLPQFGKL